VRRAYHRASDAAEDTLCAVAEAQADSTRAPVAGRRRRLVVLWAPIIVWAAVIFALSSIPSLGTDLGTWDLVLRKLAHITEYAILAFLLRRALTTPAALAVAVAYAISDEFHQTFVHGREGRPRDVVIDSIGIVLGLLAARSRR
jgi:VanZ family protein